MSLEPFRFGLLGSKDLREILLAVFISRLQRVRQLYSVTRTLANMLKYAGLERIKCMVHEVGMVGNFERLVQHISTLEYEDSKRMLRDTTRGGQVLLNVHIRTTSVDICVHHFGDRLLLLLRWHICSVVYHIHVAVRRRKVARQHPRRDGGAPYFGIRVECVKSWRRRRRRLALASRRYFGRGGRRWLARWK